jgi:hypothetical protein
LKRVNLRCKSSITITKATESVGLSRSTLSSIFLARRESHFSHRLRTAISRSSGSRLRRQELNGDYPGPVFLFSTEFPHRLSAPLKPAAAAKTTHSLKQRLRSQVVEDTSTSADFQSFFDTSPGLQPRKKSVQICERRPSESSRITTENILRWRLAPSQGLFIKTSSIRSKQQFCYGSAYGSPTRRP